jgi:SAM-dependent methyltransferase
LLQEIVLYGPSEAGFAAPEPINRGNPYSTFVEPWLAKVPPWEPILEFGGGDRRRAQRGHINLEFLKFELADAYADIHSIPFQDDTFAVSWTQAVFEHLADPFRAARELVRVTRPGGLVITEVAFMQPLHAVPYHYFNMTPWGVEQLFEGLEVLESGWFGDLSFTVDWLMQSAELSASVPQAELDAIVDRLKGWDSLIDAERLKRVASGVYLVVRKPA